MLDLLFGLILLILFIKYRNNRKFNGWIVLILVFSFILLNQFRLGSNAIAIFQIVFILNYIGLYRKDKTQNKIN